MRRSCIVLLLAASIVAASAKPSFEDWLAGPKSASTQGAKPSYEYEGEVETVEACLRAYERRDCSTDTPVKSFTYGLTCCANYGDYNKELSEALAKPMEVASCTFLEFPIVPQTITQKVKKVALFEAVCWLNDKSDTCGHPFCDKQTLTIVGSKYKIKDAIVAHVPDAPIKTNCVEPTAAEPDDGDEELRAPAAGRRLTATEPAYEEYHEYEHKKFKKFNKATLYHGTMTVNSRLHNIKYEDGTFQFVSKLKGEPVEATHEEVEKAYILEPYKVELSYFKEKEYKEYKDN